jgi:hypothetical protein
MTPARTRRTAHIRPILSPCPLTLT